MFVKFPSPPHRLQTSPSPGGHPYRPPPAQAGGRLPADHPGLPRPHAKPRSQPGHPQLHPAEPGPHLGGARPPDPRAGGRPVQPAAGTAEGHGLRQAHVPRAPPAVGHGTTAHLHQCAAGESATMGGGKPTLHLLMRHFGHTVFDRFL